MVLKDLYNSLIGLDELTLLLSILYIQLELKKLTPILYIKGSDREELRAFIWPPFFVQFPQY